MPLLWLQTDETNQHQYEAMEVIVSGAQTAAEVHAWVVAQSQAGSVLIVQ
jgi:hypothetical protein